MAKKERPTQQRVKEVWNYDPEAGIFTRKAPAKFNPPTRKYGRVGDGRVSELGYVLLMIDGVNYIAGTIAWLHEYGEWPHARIKYINGNPLDNRIANIRIQDKSEDEIKSSKMTLERLKELVDYNPETGWFTWKIDTATTKPGARAGSIHGQSYRQIGLDYKKYLEHSLAWLFMTGEWPDREVDHINGVRHDNRWVNLRLATRSQNGHNKRMGVRNTSGFPGVYSHGRKFRAALSLDGEDYNFGWFGTIAEARIERLMGEQRVLGRFTTWLPERDGKIPNGDGFVTLEVIDGTLYVDGKKAWSTPQVTEVAA